MHVASVIKEIQNNTDNRVPKVALYMQIALAMPRSNPRAQINAAVANKQLFWGKTPYTFWFATKLSQEDRERIKEMRGWTIEQDIKNQN